MRSNFKNLKQLLKPHKWLLCLSLLASVATVALQLYVPILSGQAVDYIIGKGQVKFDTVVGIVIKIIIVVIGAAFFQWLMGIINNKVVYNVVRNLRSDIYRHIDTLPVSYVDSNEYGSVVSRVLNDVDQMADGLLMGFTQLFTGVITIIGTLFFMIRTNFLVAIVVIVLTPLSLLISGFISKKTYNMFQKQSEKRAEMTGLINEMVGNEKVVQAFSYEDEAESRFDAINEELVDAEFRATFFSSLTNPSTRLINNMVYAGVGIVGAIGAVRGIITVGQLTCLLGYATQFAKPFNEISGVMTELTSALASCSRVFELLDEEPETDGSFELSDVSGGVNFDDVCFSYTADKKLIEHLNLDVKPGQRIAIVGPTGSGKSTLINLLMRFYDIDSGCISMDGKDINTLTKESIRSHYGMVLQETWLKSGTIRENIAYGYPEATDEEIENAAKLTHADRFIKRLPDGYDTFLSEDGGNLSAGQKQLLCITRVMLKLPPMLILDEATSSIDTRTEQRIQRAFGKMMKDRTSFVVAHRLSTIKESDVILVMKDGAVIEQGTHDELLEMKGFYYELFNSQFSS
ncbi:MAG: ABC transporter ATP-binding protein/permease [Eubacterium sp.]|nr:ABC transporter ATP-binding protein/permease [Eubacterium sp.]